MAGGLAFRMDFEGVVGGFGGRVEEEPGGKGARGFIGVGVVNYCYDFDIARRLFILYIDFQSYMS